MESSRTAFVARAFCGLRRPTVRRRPTAPTIDLAGLVEDPVNPAQWVCR